MLPDETAQYAYTMESLARRIDSAEWVTFQWLRHKMEASVMGMLLTLQRNGIANQVAILMTLKSDVDSDVAFVDARTVGHQFSYEVPYRFNIRDQRTEQVVLSAIQRLRCREVCQIVSQKSRDYLGDIFKLVCAEHQYALSDLRYEKCCRPQKECVLL